MESDLYDLLPNPRKTDESDPDMMFTNPHSDYNIMSQVNNVLNNSQDKGISLFHCNMRSLTKNLTLLNDMSYSLDSTPDIIAIAGTRLNPNSISNVHLSNYHLPHTDSPTLEGGTAISVSKNLKGAPSTSMHCVHALHQNHLLHYGK